MPIKDNLTRIPVTLDKDHNNLLTKLRGALEAKLEQRFSVAEIVRMGLRELAKQHNVTH